MSDDVFKSNNEAYVAAKLEWDNLYGGIIKERDSWKKACFIAFGFIFCLLLSLGYQLFNTQVEVVKVKMYEDGFVQAEIGSALKKIADEDMKKHIVYSVAQFIKWVREVPITKEQLDGNVKNIFTRVLRNSPAEATIVDWLRGQNYAKARQQWSRTIVEVKFVIPETAKGKTWRAEWVERQVVNGRQEKVSTYNSVLQIAIVPPRTQAGIFANGLGIYIQEINWSVKL